MSIIKLIWLLFFVGEEAYENMNYGGKDDSDYETINYENATAAVAASKQGSGSKLSPTKSVTPTRRIVIDRWRYSCLDNVLHVTT